jgi:CheY-like chemotaxis protein
MLAGTSSLMGLSEWEQILASYEDLLVRYNETGLPWDDRIAQVTSELIEKEDVLVASHESDPSVAVDVVVSPDELAALREEISVLQESMTTEALAEAAPVTAEPSSTMPGEPTPPIPESTTAEPTFAEPVPMNGVINEIRNVYQVLIDGLESGPFASRDWPSDDIVDIRNQLYFLDFYICSVEQMIERQSSSAAVQQCSLVPLKTVLSDFANEVSSTGERALDIILNGEAVQIDPRLLPTAGAFLQRLITDVFNRSERSTLGITVNVKDNQGALHWQIIDDGNNLISDSQLDHEDQLAFYPGLKDVRKMLSRHHGVLWVEPSDGREARFEFTLPASKETDSFMAWGEDIRAFAVRSVQLCDLIPSDNAIRGKDSRGEFLSLDNRRVPLLKLDVFFKEAPSGGGMIVVIGSLEKRVAFYVPDDGVLVEGKSLEGVIPVWQGPTHLVAQLGDRRVALLDADQILEEYLDLTGELNAENVSGGVVEDESELSNSQASYDSDVKTPPDQFHQADEVIDVEVLVVEQSETLKGVFTDILNHHRIRAAFAGGVDEAIELIHAYAPRVIVSEFRMPTMAAKVLVETLDREGQSIPVLVTTSQSGKTADLLVEKLGAAGYLSKPLQQKEVVSRINGFLAERAQV